MGKGLNRCIIALLVVTYLMRFFHVPDPAMLFALPLAVCLTVCLWKCPLRLTHIDFVLLLLLGYGLFSPSVNCTSSLISATDMAVNLLSYFLARYLFLQKCKETNWLCVALTMCIAALSLLALYQFAVFDRHIHEVGFASLYDFRYLYRPLGVPSNEWNALQWLWGGIVTLAYLQATDIRIKRLCLLSWLMVWATILLSFSRGGYIAVSLCCILFFIYWCIKYKFELSEYKKLLLSKWFIVACFAALTIVIGWQYRAEVRQTFRMNETVSQQRSVAGRLEALSFAKEVVKHHSWGVGKGNYAIAYDFYKHGETRSDGFTSYAGNIVAKTMVEGGYIGLILYALLVLSVGILFVYAKRQRRNYWVIFPFFFGFLVKEATFPTFYDSDIIQLSVFVLLAYAQQDCGVVEKKKNWKVAASTPMFLWMGLFIGRHSHTSTDSTPTLIQEYQEGHSIEALCKALQKSPMDIQLHYYKAIEKGDTIKLAELSADYPDRIQFRWTLYEWYRESGQIDKAVDELTRCILRYPRLLETDYWQELLLNDCKIASDVQRQLNTAIQMMPEDVMQLAKNGSVALQLGNMRLAEKYLMKAKQMLPNLSRVWGNLATLEANKGYTERADLYRKRMELLEQGIFVKDNHVANESRDINTMLEQKYRFLFIMWYKTI